MTYLLHIPKSIFFYLKHSITTTWLNLAFLIEIFAYFRPLEVDEAYQVVARMGQVFVDFELYSSKRFLSWSYIYPLRPASVEVVGGSVLVEIDTTKLPRSVFVEQLQDERLLTALKSATGRNVEIRTSLRDRTFGEHPLFERSRGAPRRFMGIFQTGLQEHVPFFYKVELDVGMLRGIPRFVDFDRLPPPDPDHYLSWPVGLVQGGHFALADFPSEILTKLTCGATRQGKSMHILCGIKYLKEHYSSDYYQLVIMDLKDDKTDYRHVVGDNNVIFFDKSAKFLEYIDNENRRRGALRRCSDSFNVFEHNQKAQDDNSPFEHIPYTIVIIDELYMFTLHADKKQQKELQTRVATTLSNGIYWDISTQRPSTDIIGGATKTNFVTRMSFSLPTSTDGSVVFGHESLGEHVVQLGCPGRGFILIGPDFYEFQSAYAC